MFQLSTIACLSQSAPPLPIFQAIFYLLADELHPTLKPSSVLIMKNIFLALFTLFCALTATAQQETLQQEIAGIQETLNNAVEKNDVDVLSKHLHPNFYVHQLNGPFIQKDSLLASFRKGGSPYKVFQPKAETFIVIDKSTIITAGKEVFQHKTGTYANNDHHREFYHVWNKHKGQWVLAGRTVAVID
jgi:hypothetical protein